MSAEHIGRSWLPLGHAQIIDWRFLDRDESAKGSTAWIGRVHGETVLVRTWCEETTTHFELMSLCAAEREGRVTVRVARPEPARLQVRVDVQLGDAVLTNETVAFIEHPRTGQQARVGRESEVRRGGFDPATVDPLGPAHAEIFEYAPESALQTDCGRWLQQLLEGAFRGSAQPAIEVSLDRLDVAPAQPRAPTPPPPPRAPTPLPPRDPTPLPPREPTPVPVTPTRLIASTNAGESWELAEDETFIGRSKQCAIVLKSQRVSRKHASVTREADGWFINDMGAANGIWAGAEKVERGVIEDGAEYIIGDVVLTFTFA